MIFSSSPPNSMTIRRCSLFCSPCGSIFFA
ncbi:hypothetical protein VPHK250G1_0060 [Vibrio phage K250 g1]